MKILTVAGARPNFMKLAPVYRALQSHPGFEPVIVHTGQHYDQRMSEIFFDELGLPEPDLHLDVGSDTHAGQTAKIMVSFEAALQEVEPALVVVVGDVNSTVACALVAQKRGTRVAHVEAGLRSFDRTMPEEVNRVLTDQLSELLFVTEPSGVDNLAREGNPASQIHFVGNVMIDSLNAFLEMARERPVLKEHGLREGDYVAVTLHRPATVDAPDRLAAAVETLCGIAEQWRTIFPVHPRTAARLESSGHRERLDDVNGLTLCSPMGYLDFLCLLDAAGVVLTDSGGVQEETTVLGTPCLTARSSTERPITIDMGTNELVHLDPDFVCQRVEARIEAPPGDAESPPLWDGEAAGRIVRILERKFLEP